MTVSNLYVTGLSTGQGYAALFRLYNATTATGTPVLTNYSAPVGLSGGIARLTGYTVVLPVSQTSQFQTLQLEIPVNESGSSTLTPVAFDNGATVANVTYDMASGQPLSENFGSVGSNPNGSLSLTLQAVPMGGKAPTYLWLPSNNGTVNGLPLGLERYTGEQSFDLVVVNVSASVTSDPIPLPWGGTASGISFTPGLSTFLVPRGQFLASPLGQALLLGAETAYANASATPSLLTDSGVASLLTGFGGANLSADLSAYWQDRAIASGPGTIFGTTETGTSNSSALQVNVMAAESTLANNTGGLPSNPSLYSTVGAPPAVQAVVTLNVTSTATLDLLLAGLLDNTTGGVNGTFQSVTNQAGFLGLASSVVTALANAVVTSEGLYGAPGYNEAPPASGGLWGDFWNSVSAVTTTIAGAVVSLVEVTWDATVAAVTYFDHLAHEALAVGGQLLARAATTLVDAGKVIVSALNALLLLIENAVIALLKLITAPLEQIADSYYTGLNASMNSGNASAFGNALSGPFFLLALGLGTAVEIALALITPFELGPGFLVSILIGLLITVALQAASLSGVVGALDSVSSFGGQIVRDFQGWVNGTCASADVKNATRYNQLASIFSLIAAVAVLPFSIGLLTHDLGFAGDAAVGNPVYPIVAFALGIITLVLHFVFVIDHVPISLLIFGAILGGLAWGLSARAISARAPGPWKIMAAIDLGVATAGLGVSIYEILSES
ncbi:MAG: hypothetical protein ACYCPN_07585 [Thermoplasmata archaeon]